MKITKEHYATMANAIGETIARNGGEDTLVARYNAGDFPRADRTRDLQKRFCFDLLYSSGLGSFVCDTIYAYANDDHIYTALRRICPTVNRNF